MGEPRLIEQAYRFELSPAAEQAVFLGACCGAARFWFNQALDEVKRRLERRAAGEEVTVPWSYRALCSEFDRDWRAEPLRVAARGRLRLLPGWLRVARAGA